jgi:hypothetical protein
VKQGQLGIIGTTIADAKETPTSTTFKIINHYASQTVTTSQSFLPLMQRHIFASVMPKQVQTTSGTSNCCEKRSQSGEELLHEPKHEMQC